MKKLFTLALSAMMLVSISSFAQKADSLKKRAKTKTKTTVTKTSKKVKAAAADAKTTATNAATTTTTTVTKKAADTKAAASNAATATSATVTKKVTETKASATKTVTEGVNKSADKAIGKDAKGRTIYLGPKGGEYTLSASGKKTYLKAADKIKVN